MTTIKKMQQKNFFFFFFFGEGVVLLTNLMITHTHTHTHIQLMKQFNSIFVLLHRQKNTYHIFQKGKVMFLLAQPAIHALFIQQH